MSKQPYTDEELKEYFGDRNARHRGGNGYTRARRPDVEEDGLTGYFMRRFHDRKKAEAAAALTVIAGLLALFSFGIFVYTLTLLDELPTFEQLDNPNLDLATVAYTADGRELARYAFENRTWVPYDQISPHVIDALLATEDHRFYSHWGIDFKGIMSAMLDVVTEGDLRGASTISQQLARNLYNEQIGHEVSIGRKLKEAITAVQLERRYTKREIVEMYLNTVEYVYRAFGIEAAARTFFNKPAGELDILESATLVGMLQNPSRFNPIRFPERAASRRNEVLGRMVAEGHIGADFYAEHRDDPVVTNFNPSGVKESFAPYFAEYVRNWLREWASQNDVNLYADGLVVYTTLDSRLQEMAQQAVTSNMDALQKVVDYEWSRPSGYSLGHTLEPYVRATGYEPFKYFWESKQDLVNSFVRETARYQGLVKAGVSPSQALSRLQGDEAFMDSLKTAKTRLEAGLVSLDPNNGHVKAWVGGRDLAVDWYDHVATAKRQPGSTFKPFVYTAAIDNGYAPSYRLPDSTFRWRNPETGQVWAPGNFGGQSGELMTLREALSQSNNLITARVITQLVNPSQVAFYARRMGIESELEEVPALGLGTSDVSLLEITSAYGTLASGGLHYEPTVVTRIQDRFGNVLYEARPVPEEALSEQTAYTVVDMMRGVVDSPRGTGIRLKNQYSLHGFDLAAKTGTTQNNADGWFILMHPDLVTGAWVGFNDRRIAFRSNFWGQGAHNALFIVGDFFKLAAASPEVSIEKVEFPTPVYTYGREVDPYAPLPSDNQPEPEDRVGW